MGSSSWAGREKRTEAISETPINFRKILRKVLSFELSSALSETYAAGMDSSLSVLGVVDGVDGWGDAGLARVKEDSRDEDMFRIAD